MEHNNDLMSENPTRSRGLKSGFDRRSWNFVLVVLLKNVNLVTGIIRGKKFVKWSSERQRRSDERSGMGKQCKVLRFSDSSDGGPGIGML